MPPPSEPPPKVSPLSKRFQHRTWSNRRQQFLLAMCWPTGAPTGDTYQVHHPALSAVLPLAGTQGTPYVTPNRGEAHPCNPQDNPCEKKRSQGRKSVRNGTYAAHQRMLCVCAHLFLGLLELIRLLAALDLEFLAHELRAGAAVAWDLDDGYYLRIDKHFTEEAEASIKAPRLVGSQGWGCNRNSSDITTTETTSASKKNRSKRLNNGSHILLPRPVAQALHTRTPRTGKPRVTLLRPGTGQM